MALLRKAAVLGLCAAALMACAGGIVWWLTAAHEKKRSAVGMAGDWQTGAMDFVHRSLIDSRGLVETFPARALGRGQLSGHRPEALLESAGLWLEALHALGKKDDFGAQVGVIKDHFGLLNGTLSWRLSLADGGDGYLPAPYSASIDDLRVIRVLLEASQDWKEPQYAIAAGGIADALYEHSVREGVLLHQSILQEKEEKDLLVDVSYLDLDAIRLLASRKPEWLTVLERSRSILEGALLPTGLYHDKYDVKGRRYYDQEKNLINSMICALHAAQQGMDVEKTLRFLRSEWHRVGCIYGRYDPVSAIPLVAYESISVYALAMRVAILGGDLDLAQRIRARMLELRTALSASHWMGALTPEGGHAFDHLQAMIALDAWDRSARERS